MEDLKISDFLLAEVLDWGEKECVFYSGFILNKNTLKINLGKLGIEEINIYEFAFKCKEWAISKGYIIKSKPYDYNEDTTFSGGYFWITRIENGHCPNCGANRSEVQAIIDGCEWILEKEYNTLIKEGL